MCRCGFSRPGALAVYLEAAALPFLPLEGGAPTHKGQLLSLDLLLNPNCFPSGPLPGCQCPHLPHYQRLSPLGLESGEVAKALRLWQTLISEA